MRRRRGTRASLPLALLLAAFTGSATLAAAPAKTVRVTADVAERLGQALQALAAGSYDEAATLYERLIPEAHVGFQEPRVGYAIARMRQNEDSRALAVVLDGLAEAPDEPVLHELLGDLRNREERVVDALESWRAAWALDPTDRVRDKIAKGQRELRAGRNFATDLSAHFNVRYDGEVDELLAGDVGAYLEQQYWVMADTFDHAPRQPITVLLYVQQEFREVTQTPDWVGGLYDGKIRLPLGGLSRLHDDARRLLRHELAHAFVHTKSRGKCPAWLHEGIAQRLEGRELTRAARHEIVRTLREIEPLAWDRDGVNYSMALSLASYLERRRDLEALVGVLERLGEGDGLDEAFAAVFGAPYPELCRDWAREMLEAGSR